MQKKRLSVQFIRFLIVGGTATALHYVILVALVQTSIAQPIAASTIGFAVSAVLNYVLNRHFTFQSSNPHAQAFPRFMIVALTGLALNAGLLWGFIKVGVPHYLLSQLFATVGTLLWNFFINKIWTFSTNTRINQINKDATP